MVYSVGKWATGDEEAEFHVDGKGVVGEVGAGKEQAVSVGDGALDMKDAALAIFVFGAVFFGPVVDGADGRDFVTEGAEGVISALAFDAVGGLDDDVDADAAMSGRDEGFTDARNFIDGVADDGQPLRCQVHDF